MAKHYKKKNKYSDINFSFTVQCFIVLKLQAIRNVILKLGLFVPQFYKIFCQEILKSMYYTITSFSISFWLRWVTNNIYRKNRLITPSIEFSRQVFQAIFPSAPMHPQTKSHFVHNLLSLSYILTIVLYLRDALELIASDQCAKVRFLITEKVYMNAYFHQKDITESRQPRGQMA